MGRGLDSMCIAGHSHYDFHLEFGGVMITGSIKLFATT
jgi:hypothetical protein